MKLSVCLFSSQYVHIHFPQCKLNSWLISQHTVIQLQYMLWSLAFALPLLATRRTTTEICFMTLLCCPNFKVLPLYHMIHYFIVLQLSNKTNQSLITNDVCHCCCVSWHCCNVVCVSHMTLRGDRESIVSLCCPVSHYPHYITAIWPVPLQSEARKCTQCTYKNSSKYRKRDRVIISDYTTTTTPFSTSQHLHPG